MIKLRAGQQTDTLLYASLCLLMGMVFVADIYTPLGVAVWVIYLFPASLAYFVWRPQMPLALAAVATILVILGSMVSEPGMDPAIARLNRGFGVATVWVVGITGYFFVRNKLAVRREEWLQAGHVGLTQAIGGDQTLERLGESTLRFLAEYVGAQAGAIFIQNGEGFRRYASYALPAETRTPERVEPGQGLVGQAIKDGRSFLLRDVPEDALYFGSGLGQGKPRTLLVAPAKADGEINAVVELGFIGNADEIAVALFERASESIGIAVRSAKYRARLQDLLEETRRQSEELQVQSDELRAANEELEEQTRSLQESQSRLELQQTELEQTNAQLEGQTQLLGAQRDELGRAQSVLQEQTRELEQASRYKSEFVANMSHELRTPLNSLLIMARLLAENRLGTLTDEQVKYAQTIEGSGNDLLALINDILDISKIEAGRVELQIDRMPIGAMTEKLKAAFQAIAAQKGLAFRVEIAPDAPGAIETDSQRLEQIMKNFLSNAVKFTETGEVVLAIRRAAGNRIAFVVRDTGIGIDAGQQHSIFEPFRQADGTINRRYGGTGLGLSISRELARLLGAEIQVESAAGRGSTFTLIAPEVYDAQGVPTRSGASTAASSAIAEPPVPAARTATPPRLPRKRREVEDDRERLTGDSRVILAVEDDVAFTRVLYDLVHEAGFQCLIADTADEGVVMARQYMPDAIVLDMGLPDHTGMSVLERLKRDLRTRHIPVHVVSVDDYTQTALSFGALGYMLKPVTRERLMQALERVESRLTQRLRRVLIVEDDVTQLESLQLLLKSRDVETVGAASAAACLEELQAGTFDCMVLDLTLPDASGFDVLEHLSHEEAFAFPPVIVYTGRDLSVDEELRLRRFSKSVIIKGAKSPERLLDEVTLFLHQVVAELPEKQQKMLARSLNRDATLEGRRVLVVEDDVRNIFSLTSILEPHGVAVDIARNGREALQSLDRASSSVDLVLMDIMMPEMDGLTAMREIRTRPQWKNLPIIALTAKAMRDDQEECLAAGANDYLAKPLDVDKLLSLVRVWMPR